MSKYTLTIEGDFEKGECDKCSLSKKYACVGEDSFFDTYLGCIFQEIEDCPLEEVKQGEWIKIEVDMCYFYICSNCGCDIPENRFHNDWFSNFCPNCGTPMKGGK